MAQASFVEKIGGNLPSLLEQAMGAFEAANKHGNKDFLREAGPLKAYISDRINKKFRLAAQDAGEVGQELKRTPELVLQILQDIRAEEGLSEVSGSAAKKKGRLETLWTAAAQGETPSAQSQDIFGDINQSADAFNSFSLTNPFSWFGAFSKLKGVSFLADHISAISSYLFGGEKNKGKSYGDILAESRLDRHGKIEGVNIEDVVAQLHRDPEELALEVAALKKRIPPERPAPIPDPVGSQAREAAPKGTSVTSGSTPSGQPCPGLRGAPTFEMRSPYTVPPL